MSKSFKKFVLCAMSIFYVASLPFVAFCSGGPKKIREEKKPFKSTCFEDIYGNKFSVQYVEPQEYNLRLSSLSSLVAYNDVVVLESGSVGATCLLNMRRKWGLDEAVWRKEIFPLNAFCASKEREKVFETGFEFVLTNIQTGKIIIFNIEFGNTFSKKKEREYNLASELEAYERILNIILSLDPVSSNGTLPKMVTKSFIASLSLSPRIKSVKDYSFFHTINLVSVNFLGKIESLGDFAFCRCEKLENVNFSEGVEYVGNNAFEGCRSLESVTFPKGLKFLNSNVFKDCEKLKKVMIPNSLEGFMADAFKDSPNSLKIIYMNKEFNKSNFLIFLKNNYKTICGKILPAFEEILVYKKETKK